MIRLRRRLAGQDEGSALIFVMLIAALVLILMGTASATLISNIRPTGESIQTGQALAAAEAGIEDFTAKINTNCSDTTSFQCSWANGQTSNSSVTNPATQTGTPVTNADGSQTIEASFGIALREPGDDPEHVVARADGALYQAKRRRAESVA